MDKHTRENIYKQWRNSKEPKFTVWLDQQEKKCAACEKFCGNPWCPFNEEAEDTND